jgi:hypothetical protein
MLAAQSGLSPSRGKARNKTDAYCEFRHGYFPGVQTLRAQEPPVHQDLRTSQNSNMPARVLQFFVPVGNTEFVNPISRTVAFDVEDRRAIEKIQTADFEKSTVTFE